MIKGLVVCWWVRGSFDFKKEEGGKMIHRFLFLGFLLTTILVGVGQPAFSEDLSLPYGLKNYFSEKRLVLNSPSFSTTSDFRMTEEEDGKECGVKIEKGIRPGVTLWSVHQHGTEGLIGIKLNLPNLGK